MYCFYPVSVLHTYSLKKKENSTSILQNTGAWWMVRPCLPNHLVHVWVRLPKKASAAMGPRATAVGPFFPGPRHGVGVAGRKAKCLFDFSTGPNSGLNFSQPLNAELDGAFCGRRNAQRALIGCSSKSHFCNEVQKPVDIFHCQDKPHPCLMGAPNTLSGGICRLDSKPLDERIFSIALHVFIKPSNFNPCIKKNICIYIYNWIV